MDHSLVLDSRKVHHSCCSATRLVVVAALHYNCLPRFQVATNLKKLPEAESLVAQALMVARSPKMLPSWAEKYCPC